MIEQFTIIGRGLLGVFTIILLAFLVSRDRKNVSWRFIFVGLIFIIGLGTLMLKVPFIHAGIEVVSSFFIKLVDFSDAGAAFIFGDLVTDMNRYGYIFAFHVLPNIIFFAAIASLLYYFKVLPIIVKGFALLLRRAFHLSGAECAAAAANVFLSQVTAPIMIKPYLPRMSRAEIFCVMTGGMATIAGTVMLAIIAILGGENPELRLQFATYLLTSSILSAPAALLISHIILPKTGPVDEQIKINTEDLGYNAFDAIAKGTEEGIRVALSITGILIVFTALIFMANWILREGFGEWLGLNAWVANVTKGVYPGLTLQAILGVLFAPLAWIIGIDARDLLVVGSLLGEKVVLNEIVAYTVFADNIKNNLFMNPHSIVITTFALCSFANLTSIGVQISGFSALASNQRYTVARLAFLAVIAGNLACFLSSCIAGVLINGL